MFSCVNNIADQINSHANHPPTTIASPSRSSSLPLNQSIDFSSERSIPNDPQLLDKVLEEGIKLKQKCKQYKHSINQLENQLNENKLYYERTLQTFEINSVNQINELKAEHIIQLKEIQDRYDEKIQSIYGDIELSKHQETYYQSLKQKNNDLNLEIETLLRKIQENSEVFEKKISQSLQEKDHQYQTTFNELVQSHEMEITNIKEREIFLENENKSLNETILTLQSEIMLTKDNACCLEAKQEIDNVKSQLDKANDSNRELDEYCRYYKDENSRLERQIMLLKKDLLKYDESKNSPDCRSLKSEREQRLLQELQEAKSQIVELQETIHNFILSKDLIEAKIKEVTDENSILFRELQSFRSAGNKDSIVLDYSSDKSLGSTISAFSPLPKMSKATKPSKSTT